MEQTYGEHLPHLTSEVVTDARGPELDAYTIALEGWRRGLTLKWYAKDHQDFVDMKVWSVDKPGKLFSLSNGKRAHYFFKSRGDKVSNQAVEICSNKDETKRWLETAGVKVPEGKRFTAEQTNEEIISYASSLGFPVVLKPTDGSFGRGVMTNIQNAGAFKKALYLVRAQLGFEDVIVERYIPGEEHRLYVVKNKVVGAINRVPAHVTGDGEHSIKRLIELKNEWRKTNPRLISCLIKPDQEMVDFVLGSGKTFESIPNKGEKVYLTEKSNISIGGDSIDVLDTLSKKVKETAVRAMKAIPGLSHGAIDIIIDKTGENGVVLEINPTAQIGSLLFPVFGQARDIPAAIIDDYFPETKGIKTQREKIYFDFNDLLEPLFNKKAVVTTVAAAPVGKIYAKKYTVSGKVQNAGYHRGLRKQAFDRKLSGYIVNLDNGNIDIVVSGADKNLVNDFKNAILEDTERAKVKSIQSEIWGNPVKAGFEIKADLKSQAELLKQLMEDKEALVKELKLAKRNNKKLKESTSWKVSEPIRRLGKSIKKLKK